MAKKSKAAEGEETEAPATEGAEGEESEEGAKKGKKGLLFIIVGVVVVAAIVGGLFAGGVIGGKKKPAEDAASGDEKAADGKSDDKKDDKGAAKVADKPVYYELPQFLVNLNSTGSRTSFLKMSVTLELRDQGSVAIVDANKPRIVDVFNTYLRELRPSDVQGSAGIYRLRDELISRLNATVEEGIVKDILFSEIIVQ